MPTSTRFDVLIVYSEKISHSPKSQTLAPFSVESGCESYNLVYAYFLESCHKQGLTAAFASSADIIASGTVSSYWTYTQGTWHKHNSPCSSNLIFDKFSPVNINIKNKRRLLFSNKQVKPFNNTVLFATFFDKQKTYTTLSNITIPTISLLDSSYFSIKQACASLRQLASLHKHPEDFGQDIIMKDRFGAGGFQIYKFKAGQELEMLKTCEMNPDISYIIQPYVNFDHGFEFDGKQAPTDIRFLFLEGKVVQTFIRVAKKGDFRCNAHQGCSLSYLKLKDIPVKIIDEAKLVASKLPVGSTLFSLDFISANSGNTYLLEGNTGPGISWSMTDKMDEKMSKSLIRMIANTLVRLVKSRRPLVHIPLAKNPFWPLATKTPFVAQALV